MTTSPSTSFHSFSSTSTPRATSFNHAPPHSVNFHQRRLQTTTMQVKTTNTTSLYDVLGIQHGASGKEIRAAYRKLARAVHPDTAISNGQKDATSAADEFMQVHEAYVTLSDPYKKASYEKMMLFKSRRVGYTRVSMTNRSFSGSMSTRRSWETDQCW